MKSKSYFIQQQQRTYELRKAHAHDYNKLLSKGFQSTTATKQLKQDVGRASLTRLKDRVWIAQNSFGVTGVSLDGIKETAEVREYVRELERTGVVTKEAGSLKLTHPKIYRRY
jgi:hypothetical protein